MERRPINVDHIINWNNSAHWNRGRQQPCIHCRKPARLLDDIGRPAHKVCAETALGQLLQTDQGSAA
jgi:hypothetical protein